MNDPARELAVAAPIRRLLLASITSCSGPRILGTPLMLHRRRSTHDASMNVLAGSPAVRCPTTIFAPTPC